MTPGYRALRESAAWLGLAGRGKIVARGQDRARLLHAMTTNHVEQLAPGGGCYAFFLDAQGHILGDVNLFAFEDHHLLDTEPETAVKLRDHLDRYIIADDVTLEDQTPSVTTFALEGPGASELLGSLGAAVAEPPYSHAPWGARTVARITPALLFVFAPSSEREMLIAEFESAGAIAAIAEDALAVRLEQGRPRYGDDITESHLPQETQALHAVHFNKGCYLGQEIVERVRSRGHVNRLLVRLSMDGPPPARGAHVEGGTIMSAAFSPALGRVIAFAYLRAGSARPGSKLVVEGREAEVLPAGPVGG
ncbi:MAG TPA: glycine cleavage T C-terminal barrel domain-containing protein [Bryobacteraceae bacterium]|nr:glycine cleavage T C-terminal barrel domain-containing protein [Bryobacteraceae bacterium]